MMSTAPLCSDSNDELRQIDRGLDGAIFPLCHDRGGNATCSGLFAIIADNFGYLRLGKRVDDFERCQFLATIHAHVQWSGRLKAKASFRGIELMRRDT